MNGCYHGCQALILKSVDKAECVALLMEKQQAIMVVGIEAEAMATANNGMGQQQLKIKEQLTVVVVVVWL